VRERLAALARVLLLQTHVQVLALARVLLLQTHVQVLARA
jgi:hypothetical protein